MVSVTKQSITKHGDENEIYKTRSDVLEQNHPKEIRNTPGAKRSFLAKLSTHNSRLTFPQMIQKVYVNDQLLRHRSLP